MPLPQHALTEARAHNYNTNSGSKHRCLVSNHIECGHNKHKSINHHQHKVGVGWPQSLHEAAVETPSERKTPQTTIVLTTTQIIFASRRGRRFLRKPRTHGSQRFEQPCFQDRGLNVKIAIVAGATAVRFTPFASSLVYLTKYSRSGRTSQRDLLGALRLQKIGTSMVKKCTLCLSKSDFSRTPYCKRGLQTSGRCFPAGFQGVTVLLIFPIEHRGRYLLVSTGTTVTAGILR
jgi:hypothetical protein